MTPVTYYEAGVPNELRWLLMFMGGAFNNVLSALPDSVQVCAGFGLRTVDTGSLSSVRMALQELKVRPKRLGSFHLNKLFRFGLGDSTSYRATSTFRVNDLTMTWGPVKLYPYAHWLSLVSEYLSTIVIVKEVNTGLVQYRGKPGVVVTFEDGSSALFCPGRVISPFRPDPDLEIYPVYPTVRKGYAFEMLPVITTLGQLTGELDERYRGALVSLVISITDVEQQAYVYDRTVYCRTERGLYSLPREVQPTPNGRLALASALREDDGELYVSTWTDRDVRVTPALAGDALETIDRLGLKPVREDVVHRLRLLADHAVLTLRGITA